MDCLSCIRGSQAGVQVVELSWSVVVSVAVIILNDGLEMQCILLRNRYDGVCTDQHSLII